MKLKLKGEDIMMYKDKNGKYIADGMTLKHDDGELQKVYGNAKGDDLGFNATNKDWKGFDPLTSQIYPLYQFNLKEWEIVE